MQNLISFAVFFIVAALGLSILVVQGITGVPPMPSSRTEAADVVALLRQAGVPEEGIIYELGCGWGALVIALARAFPHARIRGIEMSPLPYWIARLRTRSLPNAIACYLMIKPMRTLAPFLDRMLEPGTPVVSLAFRFRDRTVAVSSVGPAVSGDAALYHWPARTEVS
jgi:hypothetical protein